MRIGTLVVGVLAMASGFGLAAMVIGWPVLVVGGPIVFGGAVVVLATWLTGMHQRQASEQRYAHADRYGRADPHHGYVAYDGGFEGAFDETFDHEPGRGGWGADIEEDTLDSDVSWAETSSDDRPAGVSDGGPAGGTSSDTSSASSSSDSSSNSSD